MELARSLASGFLGLPLWLLPLFVFWSLTWKGLALWRASKRGSKAWFVVLLVVNTLGILEIVYLLATNEPKVPKSEELTS